jgi:uncharacterized protein (DUF427 family)
MSEYPQAIALVDDVEPVPRRVRAELAGKVVFDTTRAGPFYPQFLIPVDDVGPDALIDGGQTHKVSRGTVVAVGLRVGATKRPSAGRRYVESGMGELVGRIRFEWDALDAWYEEDERVFVHPRNPYVRVDALRSSRRVRIERDRVVLAESDAPVMVFETGLPTRYCVDRSAVDFSYLTPTATVTSCPYKGQTTGYWSVVLGESVYPDLAWSYDFPTRQLLPVAGLVAFYDEQVDLFLDGVEQPRPKTHFFNCDRDTAVSGTHKHRL